MDLGIKTSLRAGVRPSRQLALRHDAATRQLCYWTASGMLLVTSGGWLVEKLTGYGEQLPALGLLAVGYLLMGLKSHASQWWENRGTVKPAALPCATFCTVFRGKETKPYLEHGLFVEAIQMGCRPNFDM